MTHKNICFGLAAARGMIISTDMEAGNILWWDGHFRAAASKRNQSVYLPKLGYVSPLD